MQDLDAIAPRPLDASDITRTETVLEQDVKIIRKTIRTESRILTEVSKIEKDVNTTWVIEHLLKDADDLKAYLKTPAPEFDCEIQVSQVLQIEKELGSTGIVMLDTPDPLCLAACLFEMGTFTIIAMTETELFRALLDRFAEFLYKRTEQFAKALPGRLWRIYGPEFASEPYLPPRLFRDYAVDYDKPMIDAIQKNGGFARIHSHGNLKAILDHIVSTGCDGLDPIEPPPQGDVELDYVRKNYGRDLVLFGNLEIADIENLPTNEFEKKVYKAIEQGTAGQGRGFVLMPSAAPYGRKLSQLTLRNYEKIIEIIERL